MKMEQFPSLFCSRAWANTLLICVILGGLLACGAAQAEYKCNGQLYKIKRDLAPVYAEPDVTSAILSHLEQGDRVCYVGEQGEFIIVDKRSLPLSVRARLRAADEDENSSSELVFVRQVDSRSLVAKNSDEPGWLRAINNFAAYIESWKSGIVPDDGLVPYRPVVDLFQSRVPEGEMLTNGTGSLPADRGKWDSTVSKEQDKPNTPSQEPVIPGQ